MDSRRLTGLVALIVLVVAVGALIYYDSRSPAPTTAFAPAESADESVAPAEVPIEPPAEIAAVEQGGVDAAEAGTQAAATEDEADTDVAMADPAAGEPPAAEAALPPDVSVPSFDIVRVEPSGETVIAGQAEPNATVEIMDGPTVIATAEANEGGEWVIALSEPLEPGTHDLAIQTTSEDAAIVTLSDERVTVSVPDEGSTDVLVVLNAPDAPTEILQIPPGSIEATEEQVALAAPITEQPATGGEPGTTPAAGEDVAEAPTADGASVTDTPAAATDTPAVGEGEAEIAAVPADAAGDQQLAAADTPVGAPAAIAADEGAPAPEQLVAMTPPATADDAAAAAGQTLAATEPPIAGEEPAVAGAPLDGEPQAAPETDVAATPPVASEPSPPEPMVVVTAVEAETDGSFFIAGTATTGDTVRVYLDDAFVGDATPSPSGTWLIETVIDLPAGAYVIRADQIADNGAVIARSEVPFEREVAVAILKPVGQTTNTASAPIAIAMPEMETVIIKRGDNLWRIARAAWGKGIRWSTIYQANTDQIRNPNRIYPGQVFVMPKGDATWQN